MIINSNTNSSQEAATTTTTTTTTSNLEFVIKMEDCNNNLNSLLNKNVPINFNQNKISKLTLNTTNDEQITKSVRIKNRNELSIGTNRQVGIMNGLERAPTCASCQQIIEDKYIFNLMNMYWHEECLTCSQCCTMLNQSCFFKNGQLFCKDDYLKNFGSRCNSCAELIGSNELVMRIETPLHTYQQRQIYYHLNCFKCIICEKQLQKGDEYVFRQEGIYCKNDYEKNIHTILNKTRARCAPNFHHPSEYNQNLSFSSSPVSTSSSLSTTSLYSNGSLLNLDQVSSTHLISPHLNQLKNFPNQQNSNSSFTSLQSEEENSLDIDSSKNSTNPLLYQARHLTMNVHSHPKKSSNNRRITKRPRTILNAAQRYDFREAFKQSPKPCRKVREHLADKTGLSVRVVQVWFQNERAKMKKMQRRQQQLQIRDLDGVKGKLNIKGKRKKIKKEKTEDGEQNESEDDSDDEDDDSLDEDDDDSDVDDDEEVDDEESVDLDDNETDDDLSNLDGFKKRKNLKHSQHQNENTYDTNFNMLNNPVMVNYENGTNSMNINMFHHQPNYGNENDMNMLMNHHQYNQTNQQFHPPNPIDRLYSMQNSYFCSS